MKSLLIFKKLNGDYEHFKVVVNVCDMLHVIENVVSLNDDKAYHFVQSLWLMFISMITNKEDDLFSLIMCLYLMKSTAKGFTFQIAECTPNTYQSGIQKNLLRMIWQTDYEKEF